MAFLGLMAIHATRYLLEDPGPRADFSQRVPAPAFPGGGAAADGDRLRFAVATMVSAEATFATYRRLVQRVCRDVGRKEAFVVRPSYAAVRSALENYEVDVAFVCTGTYLHSRPGNRIKLLVQPEFTDGREYRSMVVVPAASPYQALADLRGRVIAFTDPESNTGCLVPSATLVNRGFRPSSFFGKIIYTGSHDRSILAAARGLVDAAAVDSLVWDSNIQADPSLARRVRTIWRSEAFGPPPIVVPAGLPQDLEDNLRKAFLALDQDNEGREILAGIGIRRFVPAQPETYQSAVKLYEALRAHGDWP